MLTNMENQLREQGAADRLDEVLKEIPRVREDLGFIPLVTPTSQIVGTQAVLNVLTGERYKSISRETAGVLKGEYGATPAPVNATLQARVLDGEDLLEPELDSLAAELDTLAQEKGIDLRSGDQHIDDVLTYALFPQVGLKFLQHRGDPDAFEAPPQAPGAGAAQPVPAAAAAAPAPAGSAVYTVSVNGQPYVVEVSEGGDISAAAPAAAKTPAPAASAPPAAAGQPVAAPLAGNIVRIEVAAGKNVRSGDVLLILEAMKMETEVRAPRDGVVQTVAVAPGDAVVVGDTLLELGAA
jgi:oxaloacetate decarboxylase alpha subunit